MSINTVKHIVAIYQYCEAYRFNKKQGLLILWVPCNATQSDSDTVTDICLLIQCDIQHIEHWNSVLSDSLQITQRVTPTLYKVKSEPERESVNKK